MKFVKFCAASVALAAIVVSGCAQAQGGGGTNKLAATNAPGAKAAPILAYANENAEVVVTREGEPYFSFGWVLWGPNWGWTGLETKASAQNGVASAEMTGTLGNTTVPMKMSLNASKAGPRNLKITYGARVERDTPLTMIVATLNPGKAFDGTTVQVTTTSGNKSVQLPLDRKGLGEGVTAVKYTDANKRVMTIQFQPAVNIVSDGAARILLANDSVKGGVNKTVTMTVQFPEDTQWYAGKSEMPNEPGLSTWYPWQGTGDSKGSLLSMDDWNAKPAGTYGRVTRKGSQLIYNQKPIKLWGLNLCYGGGVAPEKPLAEKRAQFYRKYGINTVRFHKWVDGSGWAGIGVDSSAVEYDKDALDRMDYQVAKLKEAGIFLELSSNFGVLNVGVKDKVVVPWIEEFGAFNGGRIATPHSATFYSPELQTLQIQQTLNLLKHRNPYTKLTYAEDPAIAFIEIINEQSSMFWSSMEPLKKSATLRRQVGKQFSDWLRTKYKNQAGLEAAWGKQAMNSMAGEVPIEGGSESLDRNNILPAGNPWYWDPIQLEGDQKFRRQRLLDTMQFLTKLQDDFYARFIKEARAVGYKGEFTGSNWQAGRAFSHFANLHSDALVGTVDRHNYFGGEANATMISRPGSGILSSGMQQVANRPFMLSEWITTFPNEYGVEGPAIMGAYGLGLQGWDVSYLFQNSDNGTFSDQLGRAEWDAAAPQIMGIMPAISRHVLRGDVQEAQLVAPRNVHFESLFEGKLGFDDKVVQGYDVKELDSSKVPSRSLAVAKNVVAYTAQYKDTPVFDMKPYEKNGTLVSATKQLAWTEGTARTSGYFAMNTPATKAVVGFAQGRKFNLGSVNIEPQSRFGAIYVTVRGQQGTVDTAKDLLIVTIARARNTGQKFSPDGAALLDRGQGPIVMEPVKARITLTRTGTPQVSALDHDGKLTQTKIAVKNGVIEIDGATTKTPYYLVRYP